MKGVFIMPVKNVIKKTKTMIGKINPYYDMTSSNVDVYKRQAQT